MLSRIPSFKNYLNEKALVGLQGELLMKVFLMEIEGDQQRVEVVGTKEDVDEFELNMKDYIVSTEEGNKTRKPIDFLGPAVRVEENLQGMRQFMDGILKKGEK